MRYAILLLVPLLALLALACEGGREEEQPTPSPAATSLSPTPTPAAAVDTLAFIRDGDIWLINADGTDERRLNLSGVESFSWVSSDELDVVTGADQSGHLLVDLGGNAEPLPFPAGGSWSRDGALYVVPVDEQVVVFNRDGGEAARLDVEPPVETGEKPQQCGAGSQPDPLVFGQPVFSPDGERVLVAANCESRRAAVGNMMAPIFELPLDGTVNRATPLTVNPAAARPPRFSPDGAHLAQQDFWHLSACAGPTWLTVADPDGANGREITLPAITELRGQDPLGGGVQGGLIGYDWSPEGEAIVASFVVNICSDVEPFLESFLAGLYILKLDGPPEEKLVDGPTHSPAWSPSDRYVAYVAQDYFGEVTEPPLLRLIDVTTRQVNDLAEGSQPAWQPQP
ncbi:MAG: hypothetical protein Q7T33_06495 [Dehalococcoidia bacterium]|nr:hypothetical protein [Dehalococcoidia bacterium]